MARSRGRRNLLFENVTPDLTLVIELMILAIATGIMDAVTFPDYHVFAANQTGNTVFLAVGALGTANDVIDLRHVGISLGAFVAAGLICGQIGNKVGRLSRIWLFGTNVFQSALVFAAAGIQGRKSFSPQDESSVEGIITLLAFAAGAQVASARTVKVPEVPTTVVTSAYIDILVDPNLFKLSNSSRDRRMGFVFCLLLGSFLGSVMYKYSSAANALYLSAAFKTLASLMLLFNPGKPAREITNLAANP